VKKNPNIVLKMGDFSFDKAKNLKTQAIINAVLWLFGALVFIILGTTLASKGKDNTGLMIAGLVLALAGGGWAGYTVYKIVTDNKNQKTCNVEYFNKFECVAKPKDSDISDTQADITLCEAQKNAQYRGYAGVWVKPAADPSETGNVDAYYIDGDKDKLTLEPGTSSSKGTIYLRKPKAKNKDDKGVTASGATTGSASNCPASGGGGGGGSSPGSPA
jgi:hypothetical protein